MPLESHRRLGRLLQEVRRVGLSHHVGTRITVARGILDDWLGIEHPKAAAEGDIYYGSGGSAPPSLAAALEAVREAREIVERGYNACKPRQELMEALDRAFVELSKRQT